MFLRTPTSIEPGGLSSADCIEECWSFIGKRNDTVWIDRYRAIKIGATWDIWMWMPEQRCWSIVLRDINDERYEHWLTTFPKIFTFKV